MLSVSIATMSLYEKGERQIPNERYLLSRIFNVKIDDLFTFLFLKLIKIVLFILRTLLLVLLR